MTGDMTVKCEDGFINIRVGAIIMHNGKFLMVGNKRSDYLYSVGGRIKFGETAEQAVIREVFEETGVKMETDRLGFIHENYFIGDSPSKKDKVIYEISFFFYMKVPDNIEEFLKWCSPDDEQKMYPEFFRTELKNPTNNVKHFVTDGR